MDPNIKKVFEEVIQDIARKKDKLDRLLGALQKLQENEDAFDKDDFDIFEREHDVTLDEVQTMEGRLQRAMTLYTDSIARLEEKLKRRTATLRAIDASFSSIISDDIGMTDFFSKKDADMAAELQTAKDTLGHAIRSTLTGRSPA